MNKIDCSEKTFEEAMEELKNTVSALESGTLSLNESLQLYEKGIKLIGLCTQQLEQAKLVVTELDTSLVKQQEESGQ